MPIYDYECDNCGLKKSFQHPYDEKLEECPSCGAVEEFRKVLSTFNTQSQIRNSSKVGSLTKQYIEENRKILEDQKREIRKGTDD